MAARTMPFLFFLFACSNSLDLEDFPARYEAVLCETSARCNAVPDARACEAALTTARQVTEGVQAGRIAYDGDAAARCLDALEALGCAGPSDPFRLLAACEDVFVGQVADGGACAQTFDCASGRCDVPVDCTDRCCVGTCTAALATGAPCETSRHCAVGAWCLPDLYDEHGGYSCQTLIAEGQPCTSLVDGCDVGLYCDAPVDENTLGACRPQAGHGEPCDTSHPQTACRSYDDFCSDATATCAARGGDGATCHPLDNGPFSAADSCAYDTHCVDQTCVGDLPDGAACETDEECAWPLLCNRSMGAGTCGPPALLPVCPAP